MMGDITAAIEEALDAHTYAYAIPATKNYGMPCCKCGVGLKDSEAAFHHFNETMFRAGMAYARETASSR